MGFKSLRLKRSNVFYPTYGSSRNLAGLLSSITLDDEKLEDILEIEEQAHRNHEQGVEAEDLELLLKQAKKEVAISAQDIERIYVQILRGGHVPKKLAKADYPLLMSAFQQLLPELRDGASIHQAYFNRYQALVLFGEAPHHALSEPLSQDYDAYQTYLKAWAQVNKYSHMGGMAAKVDKFRPFADDSAVIHRFQQVLYCTNFQHSTVTQLKYYSVPQLYFWGMLLTLLLNKEVRFAVLDKLFSLADTVPLFDEHIAHLDDFVEAVGDAELSAYYQAKK
ncbi:hypothetical protein L9G15_04055 [Shewanella sp. A3A]|nr:hypothetical protein [Shewanella ferrihydritica]